LRGPGSLATTCLCFHQINETTVVQEVHTSLCLSLDLTFSRLCWFIAGSTRIDILALGLIGVDLGLFVFPGPYQLKAKEWDEHLRIQRQGAREIEVIPSACEIIGCVSQSTSWPVGSGNTGLVSLLAWGRRVAVSCVSLRPTSSSRSVSTSYRKDGDEKVGEPYRHAAERLVGPRYQ
jgi:hypothetical protein